MKLPFSSLCPLCLCGLMALFAAGCSAEAKVERHKSRADAAYAKGDLEAARIEFLNALRLEPNNAELVRKLGFVFYDKGEVMPAAQLLNRAKELEPENLEVRSKLATIFSAAGMASNAVVEAEYILQRSPANGDALLALAAAVQNTNELQSTLQRLEKLAPTQATNWPLFLAIGQLHLKNRDLTSAEIAFKRAQGLSPTNSKPHLALGLFYSVKGDTNSAETHFKSAAEAAPARSNETLAYADFKMKSGKVDEGKKIIEAALEKAPDFHAGANVLARLALAQGRTNEVASYTAQVLKTDPDNRDALLTKARLNLAQRKLEPAVEILERLAQNPRDTEVMLQLSGVHRAQNDITKALAVLDRALAANANSLEATLARAEILIARGDTTTTILQLSQLAQRFPQIPQPHYLLATAYRVRGTPDDALATYARIAQLFPKDPKPHHLAGVTYRQAGRPADARRSYEAALKVEPDYVLPIDELIELDIEQKKFADALKRIQSYIDKYPGKPMPRLLQAKVLASQEKTGEALASLDKAIQLDPEFYPAHRAMAQLHIASKNNQAAVAKLKDILAKNPRDAGSLLQLSMLSEAGKDFDAARANYEKLLEVNPNSVPALNNLAYLLSERYNQPDRAAQLALRARELAPYDPFSADTYGWIIYRRGDYQQALSVLQQAAERLSSEPEVQYHLGMAYYMTGAEQPARTALQFAVASTNEFTGKNIAADSLAILNINPTATIEADLQRLNTAVERNQKDFLAWIRLGQLHQSKGNHERAHQAYQSALAVNPRSPMVLRELATLQVLHLNQLQKGLETARQAWSISQDPSNAAALGRLGGIAGDYRWALPLLEQAFRADSSNASVGYYLALCQYSQARLTPASEVLSQILGTSTKFPERALAVHLSKLIGFHTGSVSAADAQSAAAAATQLVPDYLPSSLVSALIKSGADPRAARQELDAILQRFPDCILAQRHQAILLAEILADDAAAAPLLAKVRVALPNDVDISRAQGKLAFRRQDYREAVRLLRPLATQFPKDFDLRYYLGMAQFHFKDSAAKETLSAALAASPDNKLAAEARNALASLK